MSSTGFVVSAGVSHWNVGGRAVDCRRPAQSSRFATVAQLGRQPISTYTNQGVRTVTVKVMQGNKCSEIQVDPEVDLRRALMKEKIDLYTLGGKLTNCGGAGQCGTCVIAIEDGVYGTNGRTPKEEVLLDGKPANFRLACRTLVSGDCTIRTKPKA